MESEDLVIKEICDLLKIWSELKNTVWPAAKQALEIRINYLGEKKSLGSP